MRPWQVALYAAITFAMAGFLAFRAYEMREAEVPASSTVWLGDASDFTFAPAASYLLASTPSTISVYDRGSPFASVGPIVPCADPRDQYHGDRFCTDYADCVCGEPVAVWAARGVLAASGDRQPLLDAIRRAQGRDAGPCEVALVDGGAP